MAMQWIDGIDLAEYLQTLSGPVDETQSLRLVADLSRALVDAHAAGVVHRDIKPENILLHRSGGDADPGSGDAVALADYRLKLSDFGIARHIDQSQSMAMTRAGTMLGTPRYMSPEQCKGTGQITPAADVYSIGVTLFELLTGRLPFESDDPMRLAAMHCFDPVPPIDRLAPSVSPATRTLVGRMMAKTPGDRYADAAELLAEIERTIGGGGADIESHPRMPEHDPSAVWQKTRTWNLKSRPEQLWPLVSNTDRVNRAVGLPAVQYRTERDAVAGLRKFGSFRLGGITVSWEEHPFEWIHNHRMGILREFDGGPMKWFLSMVTLVPDGGGGTTLHHEVRIESRNLVGRMLAKIEADWKGFSKLDKLYRRLDKSLTASDGDATPGHPVVGSDPFEEVAGVSADQAARIDRALDRIADAGGDTAASAVLADYVRHAAPQPLSQIRPIALAAAENIDADAMIDAALLAVPAGLLVPRWEIICPTCRVAAAATSRLSQIDPHTGCAACDTEFRSDIATAIELVFRPHPEIRSVDEADYCIGGPEHSPHVVAQVRLAAGESLELPVHLSPGDYAVRSTRGPASMPVRVAENQSRSIVACDVTRLADETEKTRRVRSGRIRVRLSNPGDRVQVVRLERTLSRTDCLTADRVTSLSRFRECFPDQTFSRGNAVSQGPMTLICVSAADIEAFCDRHGESVARDHLLSLHEKIHELAKSGGGAVAKSIDHRLLLAFASVDDAVAVAAGLIGLAPTGNSAGSGATPRLTIDIHRGSTLIATANDRLDYCGPAVRTVLAMAAETENDPPPVVLRVTAAVYTDPAIARRYADWLVTAMPPPDGHRTCRLTLPCPASVLCPIRSQR